MNVNTKLAVAFVADPEINSWTPPVQAPSSNNRITVGALNSAALRITPPRCRYARRRFFAPSHTFEHRLP